MIIGRFARLPSSTACCRRSGFEEEERRHDAGPACKHRACASLTFPGHTPPPQTAPSRWRPNINLRPSPRTRCDPGSGPRRSPSSENLQDPSDTVSTAAAIDVSTRTDNDRDRRHESRSRHPPPAPTSHADEPRAAPQKRLCAHSSDTSPGSYSGPSPPPIRCPQWLDETETSGSRIEGQRGGWASRPAQDLSAVHSFRIRVASAPVAGTGTPRSSRREGDSTALMTRP